MTRDARLLALLLPVLVGLLLSSAPPASAGVWTQRDARGDVIQYHWDRNGEPAPQRRPRFAAIDLVRTRVVHGTDRVTVQWRVRDLRRLPELSFGARIKVPGGGPIYYADVYWYAGEQSVGQVTREDQISESSPKCAGLRHVVSLKQNRVTLSFPRSCLGSPRWIRAAVDAHGMRLDGRRERRFGDFAGREAEVPEPDVYGPRVRRG